MHRLEDGYWWYGARRALIVRLLKQHGAPGGNGKILDIGCGTGAMLDDLAPFGDVTGADFAPEALAFCRKRGAAMSPARGYQLARADVRRLPFASNTFRVVTAMDIVEHIDDDKAALREIARVLTPGGSVFITVPAFRSLWSEHDEALHHFRRYTAPHLRDVCQRSGLRVEKLSYTVTALFPIIWAYRQVSNLVPKRAGREKKANLVAVPPAVNATLRTLSDWESALVERVNLPFGVTVACVARKSEGFKPLAAASLPPIIGAGERS